MKKYKIKIGRAVFNDNKWGTHLKGYWSINIIHPGFRFGSKYETFQYLKPHYLPNNRTYEGTESYKTLGEAKIRALELKFENPDLPLNELK